MPLNDQVLNAFATSLADCVRERAKGCDDKSARIINTRPNEFVLAGFLTPRSVGDSTAHDEDEAATDLPQDSAYEQTAIGLEWMVDAQEFSKIRTFDVEVSAHVYLRVLPTFNEQELRFVAHRAARSRWYAGSETSGDRSRMGSSQHPGIPRTDFGPSLNRRPQSRDGCGTAVRICRLR